MNSEAREKVPKQRFEIAARFLELFVMSNFTVQYHFRSLTLSGANKLCRL